MSQAFVKKEDGEMLEGYVTLQFPCTEKLCDFEDSLSAIGKLHNYSSNYPKATFEKKDIPANFIELAKVFGGKKISQAKY